MDIEHCDCLSWFSRRGESHEQDGERLMRADPRPASASGDPAMAFEAFLCTTGDHRPVFRFGSGLAAAHTADNLLSAS
jgi:hypothetical protein